MVADEEDAWSSVVIDSFLSNRQRIQRVFVANGERKSSTGS